MNIFLSIMLPIFTSLIILLFGKYLGIYGSAFFSIFNMLLACGITIINLYLVVKKDNFLYLKYSSWIEVGLFNISWGFMLDNVALIMIFIITFISLLVHIYSFDYMRNDPYIVKFFSFLSSFTFFMLILVTADNLLQLFLGWEGVGICSYLLISFWNTRILANKSAIKALIVNRIGDISLIISISLIFLTFKTLDFSSIFILYPFFLKKVYIILGYKFNLLNTIGLLLLIASMAKSAQIGLHTWLPDAMEGPTPVSALLHAATMVTAGVFLIIRLSPIFEFLPFILIIMSFVGSLTAFLGASIGMLQNDIKKIIAYSTCSQLGYMIFSCGISNYSGSFFHLVNHAFFKALLFLSAGAIIHALYDEQDIRKMGNLVKVQPFIYVSFLIGSLALIGFPFLSGFYSKDFILESSLTTYNVNGHSVFWLGSLSAFLTAFYSFRLIFLVFFNNTNSYKQIIKNMTNHLSIFIFFVLLTLIIGSILSGYLLKDAIIGIGSNFLGSSVFVLPWNSNILEVEFIPFLIKLLPLILSLSGLFLVCYLYNYVFFEVIKFKLTNISYYNFFNNKWYFNNIYNYFFGFNVFNFSYLFCFKILDQGFFEPLYLTNSINISSLKVSKFYLNNLNKFILLILLNVVIFIILMYNF